MSPVLAVNRRNLSALGVVSGLLAVVYLLVPHPVAQYGAWLVVFVVWMAWFVLAGIDWLSQADF
ncbi:hypothetical protein ACFR9U_12350 [Halorientalis brevis]|uniref:Uncharacterized protein n=1 Tax=Halorientalis brevis TaxID=1126241 RepID=A0ABD6CDA6_9EURY